MTSANTSILFLFVAVVAAPVQAEAPTNYLRMNPQFLQAFRDVLTKANPSIVRVVVDGKEMCLGVVVGADGWILTKAHDLKGKVSCRLKDGRECGAKLVGVHEGHDLAMLKIEAQKLPPLTWSNSDVVRSGSWVVSGGMRDEPAAVGVVSVATRQVHEGYLGVQLETSPQGLVVVAVMDNSAAFKAGVLAKDVVLRVDGQDYTDLEAFSQMLAGLRPKDTITLTIRRDNKVKQLKATLQSNAQTGGFRAEFQNRLGSDLSNRRSGYSIILQHDSVVKPSDCGGPLVDLQGRVVGINISRAGRVESWAIPAEIVQPLIAELKSGKWTPKAKTIE